MHVCTLGLYQIYWMYKNWRCIKERENPYINAAARGFLSILFVWTLLVRMRNEMCECGAKPIPTPWLFSFLWVLLALIGQAPTVAGLFSLLSVIPLLVV